MKSKQVITILLTISLFIGCTIVEKTEVGPQAGELWRAVHLINYDSDAELMELAELLPRLKELGLNVLFLEVNYSFEFSSFPEMSNGESPITRKGARKFASACKKHGIRLIPEFQFLGHQSWAANTFPLLTVFPEFDLTPGAFPNNEGIYCREWDPLNPEVNKIVFRLVGEILDAFGADGLHVGMDEVFLLGSEFSPSTKGMDPGELFAKAVNDYYKFLVLERGVEMFMWGDRLFDGGEFQFGEWESSLNGTAAAVDRIPTDIIICPWHYTKMDEYPSLSLFLGKGFKILPASWRDVEAARALIEYSLELHHPNMLGHCFTTWSKRDLLEWPPLRAGLNLLDEVSTTTAVH